jgi:CRP-like cAMP-binding protein
MYLCTLSNRPEFADFSEEEMEKISDVLVEVTYEEGEMVINEGDVGTKSYIVLDGVLAGYTAKNNNNVNAFYKEGDMFGEVAIVKDKPRQGSIKTLTRCRLVYLTREIFRRIFEKNPNIEKEIDEKYAAKPTMIVNNKRRFNNYEDNKHDKQNDVHPRNSQCPQWISQNVERA